MHIQSLVFPGCPTCAPLGPEFNTSGDSQNALRDIFQACPSLHTLTISNFEDDDSARVEEKEHSPPIVASSLHTLNLAIDDDHSSDVDGNCICPLSRLVTPNIIGLAVRLLSGHFTFVQHFSMVAQNRKIENRRFCVDPRRWSFD